MTVITENGKILKQNQQESSKIIQKKKKNHQSYFNNRIKFFFFFFFFLSFKRGLTIYHLKMPYYAIFHERKKVFLSGFKSCI
jgi:hypothetical protein